MTPHHDKRRPRRVGEPVQVYLETPERDRLARLSAALNATKSEVIRRGLEALERQLADPDEHPALRIVGIAGDSGSAAAEYDVAREHDRFIAESETAACTPKPRRSRAKRAR
jgi:Arc/MetJ-type ribon-helix-helix transcriptional regulator